MNTSIKTMLACLLAATIFWLLNALNKDGYSTKIAYPLQIKYNDSLYIPTTSLPKRINLSISSSGWNLLRHRLPFSIKPLIYEIGNPLKIKSLSTSSMREILSSTLPNTQINEFETDSLTLNFERKIVKKVALEIDSSSIDLQRNYAISSFINITPNSLNLEGAESILKNYPNTIKIKISSKHLSSNFDEKVEVDLPKHPFIKVKPEKVLVSFEVTELIQSNKKGKL